MVCCPCAGPLPHHHTCPQPATGYELLFDTSELRSRTEQAHFRNQLRWLLAARVVALAIRVSDSVSLCCYNAYGVWGGVPGLREGPGVLGFPGREDERFDVWHAKGSSADMMSALCSHCPCSVKLLTDTPPLDHQADNMLLL